MTKPKRFLRISVRLSKLAWVIASGMAAYYLTVHLRGRSGCIVTRTAWMRKTAGRFLWALGIRVHYIGEPPEKGVLVSNHVSYLDILVHGSQIPLVFISKAEVARWPIFGPLSQWAGTLYIQRELRNDVVRVAAQMPPVLEAGRVLAFFPEGTSSSGAAVLPFRASLLAPMVENGWEVTPSFLRYELEPGDGTVEEEVAYYKPETVLGPHLLNLLGKRRVRATLTYGQPQAPGSDRKALASRLHGEVCALGTVAVEA
ncbi:MAG: lysophospholipid acyltransferase family protein [Verrucomicrobiota bacterium]